MEHVPSPESTQWFGWPKCWLLSKDSEAAGGIPAAQGVVQLTHLRSQLRHVGMLGPRECLRFIAHTAARRMSTVESQETPPHTHTPADTHPSRERCSCRGFDTRPYSLPRRVQQNRRRSQPAHTAGPATSEAHPTDLARTITRTKGNMSAICVLSSQWRWTPGARRVRRTGTG